MRTRDTDYWESVRKLAEDLHSDGCSGVPEFHRDCCLEHDCFYRMHKWCHGNKSEITRREADREFRECIQSQSRFGILSPMSWWRWIAVRLFGSKAWKTHNPKEK